MALCAPEHIVLACRPTEQPCLLLEDTPSAGRRNSNTFLHPLEKVQKTSQPDLQIVDDGLSSDVDRASNEEWQEWQDQFFGTTRDSYTSWTEYTASDANISPNRLAHETWSEQIRGFMVEVRQHKKQFRKLVRRKRGEPEEVPTVWGRIMRIFLSH